MRTAIYYMCGEFRPKVRPVPHATAVLPDAPKFVRLRAEKGAF